MHSLQTPNSLFGVSSLSTLKISNATLFPGHSKVQVYLVVLRRLTRNLKSKLAPGESSLTPRSFSLFLQCAINFACVVNLLTTTTCLGANGKNPSVDERFPRDDDVLRINKNENSITNMEWLLVEEAIDGTKELLCEMIIFFFISKVVFIDVVTFFSKSP